MCVLVCVIENRKAYPWHPFWGTRVCVCAYALHACICMCVVCSVCMLHVIAIEDRRALPWHPCQSTPEDRLLEMNKKVFPWHPPKLSFIYMYTGCLAACQVRRHKNGPFSKSQYYYSALKKLCALRTRSHWRCSSPSDTVLRCSLAVAIARVLFMLI